MRRYKDPLFAPERKRHPALAFLVILLVFLLATLLTLNYINNSRVDLLRQRVTVPNLPSSMENFSILHISDLHGLYFGANQERFASAIRGLSYNVVCITGDISGKSGDADAFLRLLDVLDPNVPVYFIVGDEDPDPILATPHRTDGAKNAFIQQAEAKGAVYLDAPYKITVGKSTLWLAPEWVYTLDVAASETGLVDRQRELLSEPASAARRAAMEAVEYQLDQLARIQAARREVADDDIHIAVTHHPLQLSAMASLQEWTATDNDSYVRKISLVLAGHYAAGQWRLPGVGAVRVPLSAGLGNNGWFPGDQQVVGLSSVMGIPQYISPGLGPCAVSGLPNFRLFNTPAVTLLTLTTKMTH